MRTFKVSIKSGYPALILVEAGFLYTVPCVYTVQCTYTVACVYGK